MPDPLQGRLVRLRALEPEDEPLLYRWINDPQVTETLAARYPMSHQQERDWIAASSISHAAAQFGVEALDDGALIGTVRHSAVTEPANREATLGIFIGETERWGQGYGTDAVRTLCRFGFEMMNLHRIQLDVLAGNDRAICRLTGASASPSKAPGARPSTSSAATRT
ncbi:MAG: GNAT family protein [Dehalococcoidia bacterium]|nr:GNAT family protein [Dehalococcoidia bacterium]